MDTVDENSFCFRFDSNDEVRFSFAMPYQDSRLQKFLARYRDEPFLEVQDLCLTRKKRNNQSLMVGCLDQEPVARAMITCRHHCCEMMASYSLEGIVESLLSGATKELDWLKKNVQFLIVPFVDKDGVEDGDQGKCRAPHDHNRDYEGESIYPTVKAIRQLVPEWSKGKLHLVLDMHCPHIRGSSNEVIYQVGSPHERIWHEQESFGAILESVISGSLPYSVADNLPFGQGWNNPKNMGTGTSMTRWACEFPEVQFASTIEIPYANASGAEVNRGSARRFGQDLAKAVAIYLQQQVP